MTKFRLALKVCICGLAAVVSTGVALSQSRDTKNVIPDNETPVLRVFPPAPGEQSSAGTGKFVIFTREPVGTDWDFIAGAWECNPSRPEMPLTKRIEFCHSSWNAGTLLDILARDGSAGMHPRFVRLQVDTGDRGYSVNLYDINYRTWDVRCLWQGRRLAAFGLLGDSIFCDSSDGWLLLDAVSGTLSRGAPFTPVETDGGYWLVRKPGEIEGCWSYDPKRGQFVAQFGPVDVPAVGSSQSRLSPDGKSRAWVLAPVPRGWHVLTGWRGGTLKGMLVLQRQGGKAQISVPIEMQASVGSGVPVIPLGTELRFSPEGQVEFRARKGENEDEDRVWSIDIASGKVSSETRPCLAAAGSDSTVLDGVPVPEYLREHASGLEHFGRGALAPAFLLYTGILEEQPEYGDCTVGVSRDGRHVLYAAKRGPLAGLYIYGDLLTKQTVRWRAPDGLDSRDSQEFVWVETPR